MSEYPVELYPFVALDPDGNVILYAQTKRQAQDAASTVFGAWKRREPAGEQDRLLAYLRAVGTASVRSVTPVSAPPASVRRSAPPASVRKSASQAAVLSDFTDEAVAFFAEDEDDFAPVVRPQSKFSVRQSVVKPLHRQAAPEPQSIKDQALDAVWAQTRHRGVQRNLRQNKDEDLAEYEVRLLDASRAGNMTAFAQWFDMHRASLASKARQIVKSKQAVEDVLQDSLIKYWRYFANIPEGIPAVEYLYRMFRVVQNVSYNYLRTVKKHKSVELGDSEQAGAAFPMQDTAFFTKELDAFVREQVAANFNADLAETFLLFYEGAERSEIAEQMGVDIITVNTRIFRVRDKLKRVLGGTKFSHKLLQNPANSAALACRAIEQALTSQDRDRAWHLRNEAMGYAFASDVSVRERDMLVHSIRGLLA